MFPAPFKVVLDANVLYPFTLRDTLLRAAAAGFFQVFWSELLLDEASRNGVTLLAGARRTFSARRHRLRFRLRDGSTVGWASPGEHATHAGAVANVLELGRALGWLRRP